jgi:hypothetical protein
MAYTLTDPLTPLRNVLRVAGSTALLLGGTMLIFPRLVLTEWGAPEVGVNWPMRLAGAFLITLGIYYLLAANERTVGTTAMFTCIVGNGLLAAVLLIAYLQQDLANLTPVGLGALLVVFVIALVGAITPLRYLRAEYRDD